MDKGKEKEKEKKNPQNPDEPIIKRLHIGGLTPSITLADLNKRLSTFGRVEGPVEGEGGIEGYGKLDAVGRPRSFVHLTLKTTAGKFSKCMNVLSGSTWKGAKLKLGEAKPDWQERLAAERKTNALLASSEPPRKKRRTKGVHAEDMALVTPDSARVKPGWTVTEMGRVLRPVKMRPERPLPPTLEEVAKARTLVKGKSTVGKGKGKGRKDEEKEERKRRRRKEPVKRARRVKIDVTKWESTQLKGIFLESQGAVPGAKRKVDDLAVEDDDLVDVSDSSSSEEEEESGSESEEEEEEEVEEANDDDDDIEISEPSPDRASSPLFPVSNPNTPGPTAVAPQRTQTPTHPAIPTSILDNNTDTTIEKSRALNLLSSLFADAEDEDDWIGRESVGSDVDEEELLKHERKPARGEQVDVEFEIVPKDAGARADSGEVGVLRADHREEEDKEEGETSDGEEMEGVDSEERVDNTDSGQAVVEKSVEETKEVTGVQAVAPNLKDLFAPREEEAGFSLLGHLDLDMEDIDEELAFALEDPVGPARSRFTTSVPAAFTTPSLAPPPPTTTNTQTTTTTTTTTYINPRDPLFFFPSLPPPSHSSHSSQSFQSSVPHPSTLLFFTSPHSSKKQRDALDQAQERGWYWRDAAVKFWRTEGEGEVRRRWEEGRGELTREWRRRAREGGRRGRNKGGRGGEE